MGTDATDELDQAALRSSRPPVEFFFEQEDAEVAEKVERIQTSKPFLRIRWLFGQVCYENKPLGVCITDIQRNTFFFIRVIRDIGVIRGKTYCCQLAEVLRKM